MTDAELLSHGLDFIALNKKNNLWTPLPAAQATLVRPYYLDQVRGKN